MNTNEVLNKLIAEIERRMENYNATIEMYCGKKKSIKAERDSWKWAECKWFFNLITSLQQEQPTKGYDEAYLNECIAKGINMNTCKNPDKIYIHEASAHKLAKPELKEYHTEYIRKDALLEYLQKEYEASKWFYEAHAKPGELHIGKCEAYKQVIDKIESL